MESDEAYYWLIQSERRKSILVDFNQPLTATHIARRTGINLDSCLHLLWGLVVYGFLYYLNAATRHSRLYWLTTLGQACQTRVRKKLALPPLGLRLPMIPWDLYSSVCYNHRSAVLKALHEPMQAAAVKRRALFQNPQLRMSANNVRDVMRYLLSTGSVHRVIVRQKAHPRYELTDLGGAFQKLLMGANAL